MRWLIAAIFMLILGGFAEPLLANGPVPWQIGQQAAATTIMERLHGFHGLLVWVITIITLFVLGLLAYVCWKFRADRHPTPSRRSHNTVLEIIWTTVPVLILLIIAIPSFKLLYYMDVVPETDMTVKAIGHQWYWSYEYPDNGDFTFDAYMLSDDELEEGQKRLLETDNRLVLPVGMNIRVQVTSTDVLHAWAMPPFGVKVDAVPGRLNELWFNINEPGTYYGQCSEICGVNHGFMPITIEAVSQEEFATWVETAQQEFARAGEPDRIVAEATALPQN